MRRTKTMFGLDVNGERLLRARRLILQVFVVLLGSKILLISSDRSGQAADGSSWICPKSRSKPPAADEKCPPGKMFCSCGGAHDGLKVWYSIACLNAFPLGCGIPKGEPDCVRFKKCAVCNNGTSLPNEACVSCVRGFKGGDCYEDIDECKVTEHYCEHECKNVVGSFYCSCQAGHFITENGKNCSDVDECALGNGGCRHNCTNTNGSYSCSCTDGYVLGPDKHSCKDVDECLQSNGGCNQTCENTEGSYFCLCSRGFLLGLDKHGCFDVDECASANGGCTHNCLNLIGSYNCSCNSSYSLGPDNHTCKDVDECAAAKGGCGHSCNNTVGSYFCYCEPGYDLEPDQRSCADVDECRLNTHKCQQSCENVVGFYKCSCFPGSKLEADGHSCTKVKWCSDPSVNCEHDCVDVPGSYVCTCRTGYSLASDKVSCTDEDECRENNGGCPQQCVNSIGSFECICFAGFVKSAGLLCSDINECENGKNGCEQNCTNTPGSYYCSCLIGFVLLSDHHKCLEFKQGETHLSEGPSKGYVSMQLDTSDGLSQAFTICETRPEGIKEKEATVICRSMKFVSGSVIAEPSKHNSEMMANRRMFGRDLDCDGDEENLFQCTVDPMLTNCTTQNYPAVSCDTDKDMMQRLRVGNRSSFLMTPEIFLNNSWKPVFFEDIPAASVGCRLLGYDTFLYSTSSTQSAGKIGLSCASPDYSTLDECDIVAVTKRKSHQCIFSDQFLFEIYPPDHGFGNLVQCINREAQENVTLEIWSCAGVTVRVFGPQKTFENYYEIRLDPFDIQKHSKNPHVSLWECSGSCSLKANSSAGTSFTCEPPYDTKRRVLTHVTLEFSVNSLQISSVLQGYSKTGVLPKRTRRILWPVKPELSALSCLAIGNAKHEMIVKVSRRKGLNQCLFGTTVDLMAQCGDSYVDQAKCTSAGCCWLNNTCYLPRYSTYLGAYDGASSPWKEMFSSPPIQLSKAGNLTQMIQMCLDECRNNGYTYSALDDFNCRCGSGSLALLSKATENTTEAHALFETLYELHRLNLRPLEENLGKVILMTNSPQSVDVYAEVMLLVSNFLPNKVTIEIAASKDLQFTTWQGPRTEAAWAQGDQLPSYCQNRTGFCSLVLRHPYEKPGNYAVMVKLRGLLPTESFNISVTFKVLSKESLSKVLGNVIFVNGGPSYPGNSIQFLLSLEKVSPGLRITVNFSDFSPESSLDVNSPNATLPSWVDEKILPSAKSHILQFFHVFTKEGDYTVYATLTDSIWDANGDTVTFSTTVKIKNFLNLIGNIFILNDGPVLKGYNITFVLMREHLVPQVTVIFNPANGEVPFSVFFQENTELPGFVSQHVKELGMSTEQWKSYPRFTTQHNYSASGVYLAEAVISDAVKIHNEAKILSLEMLVEKVVFFVNSPVLVNKKATLVLCLEDISPNMQIQIDFGDTTSTILTESINKTTILPTWAMEVLSNKLENVENIYRLYRTVTEHIYVKSGTYRPRVVIWDRLLGRYTDFVEVATTLEVQSLESFLGQSLFSSTSPSNLEQAVTFILCFEKFIDSVVAVVDPNDGTSAKPVTVVKKESIVESLHLFSSALWNTSCRYFGILVHRYDTVGEYKALAQVSDPEVSGYVVTMTTTVVIECKVMMKLSVSNYKQKQQTYMFTRSAYAEFYVKIDSNCPSLPAEYQWYLLSTKSRVELNPVKGEEVRLPGDVNVNSAVLAIPPNVLDQPVYVIAAEVRVWSANWTYNWMDSVIIETRDKDFMIEGSESVGIDAVADIPVKEVDILSNVTLDGSATINGTCRTVGFAYSWFCTRAGQSLPADALTNPGSSVDGCFGHGLLLGNMSQNQFPAVALIHTVLPEVYTFHLFLSSPNYTSPIYCALAVRLIALTSHEAPRVTIFCKMNCESRLQPNQALALVAYCLNCLATESVGYVWEMLPTSSNCTIQAFDWKSNSLTGDGESYIIINPNVFVTNREEMYEVTVTVTRRISKLSGSASVFISPTPVK